MDVYMLVLALMGLAFLFAAWVPHLVYDRPLSLPFLYVAVGFLLFALPTGLVLPNPLESGVFTQRFTEMLVIISLTGAGLKLARPIGWRSWSSTWRLLFLAMPLCIVASALLGMWATGLVPASAMLLAAVLAPTDPVLASDVQVGPPEEGTEGEVRFALTSEAGLNDGLAFPFVYLAIAMVAAETTQVAWFRDWFVYDLLFRVAVGTVSGLLIGHLLTQLIFRMPTDRKIAGSRDGFVVVAITLLTYGLTELLHGYGFLAVFVAALYMRQNERSHRYHEALHNFSEGLERILMVLMLILFGGLLAEGLLAGLSWTSALVALGIVFVIRPLTGLLSLAGSRLRLRTRAAISFFGIRGIGSLYYLAFALNQEAFQGIGTLWSTVAFAILASIVVHGASASYVMRYLDRRDGVRPPPVEAEA